MPNSLAFQEICLAAFSCRRCRLLSLLTGAFLIWQSRAASGAGIALGPTPARYSGLVRCGPPLASAGSEPQGPRGKALRSLRQEQERQDEPRRISAPARKASPSSTSTATARLSFEEWAAKSDRQIRRGGQGQTGTLTPADFFCMTAPKRKPTKPNMRTPQACCGACRGSGYQHHPQCAPAAPEVPTPCKCRISPAWLIRRTLPDAFESSARDANQRRKGAVLPGFLLSSDR